ncbi:HD-GYP domain-containing protein [Cyanobium sp. CH-040]|uniref:HD-GYP domain-containing protein n=1 Tax=Cyanobium sp. CH-040 TaxID=2823708 RepID=UPI0020CD3C26|nr:HD-GYP domain-containing protein [Cyanobium sp. CH-040]
MTRAPIGDSLGARLRQLHSQLLEVVPAVDRIGCALYDPRDDLLRTFVNSTRSGVPIEAYEWRLAETSALHRLASVGGSRVIDDIPAVIKGDTPHSRWLLEQGYRSSFTVPLAHRGSFIGFLFFDSLQPAAFTAPVQRSLELFAVLVTLTIGQELDLVRSIATSAQVAREFANLRDTETGGHLERMAHYARLIGRELQASHGLSDEYIEHLHLFAPLHDIGKIGIPDEVLLKPGQLDAEQRRLMESHVHMGVQLLEKLIADLDLQERGEVAMMRNVVADHHECLDGSGYPRGLRGEEISLEARIIAVADVFDALTSHRPYKSPWTLEAALDQLQRLVELGKLDGDCVAALRRRGREAEAIRDRFRDSGP